MGQLRIEVDMKNMDEVKTRTELLSIYIDDLPTPLKKSLKEFVDCDHFEYDADYFTPRYGTVSVFADGKIVPTAVYINKILKRIRCEDKEVFFKFCKITNNDGATVMTIGDK